MEVEHRSFPLTEVEIRTAADGRTSFRGLAATYGDWSKDLGGFKERIEPSAFLRAIGEGQDVPFLVNHDPNLFLGRTGTGTVKLRSVDRGLEVAAEALPDTQAARDLKALGDEVRSMSFGFQVPKGGDEWNWKATPAERALRDVNLRDVSILTGATPAYNDTTAEVRSLLEEHGVQPPEQRDYTTAERVALAKAGKAMPIRNADGDIIDGGYPIDNTDDLGRAIQAIGRAGDPVATKAYITKRAKALGASDQIPDTWRSLDSAVGGEALRDLGVAIAVFEQRVGAVLSAASQQRVADAMGAMQQAHGHLQRLMADAGAGQDQVDTGDTVDVEMSSLERRLRLVAAGCADTREGQAEREPAA